MVEVVKGDLFASNAHTLVNTVNTVGVMGKGIALEFRKRFPQMYQDYLDRCARSEVQLGRPYLYRGEAGPWIVNFPTKSHWRAVSRLGDIIAGLEYLERHYREWGITSLAVPPLGCGNGQLEWHIVGPVLYRHLARLDIPVKLFAPANATPEQLILPLNEPATNGRTSPADTGVPPLEPGWVAVAAIVDRVQTQPYRPGIGRVMLQKIAYFAGVAGIPVDVEFTRSSFGPFASRLKPILTRLVNNGVLREEHVGSSFLVEPGPTFAVAARKWRHELEQWDAAIERVADLFLRIHDTRGAEIAATVHFASQELEREMGRTPAELEIFNAVGDWKRRHRHPPSDQEIADTIRSLNLLGWLRVPMSNDLPTQDDEELLYA